MELFEKYDRNFFPVLGKENELFEMVMLNNIQDKMFEQDLLNTIFVVDYYMQAPTVIDYYDWFEQIVKVFEETQGWNVPVIKDGKYEGIISKSKLFSEYRKLMLQLSDE